MGLFYLWSWHCLAEVWQSVVPSTCSGSYQTGKLWSCRNPAENKHQSEHGVWQRRVDRMFPAVCPLPIHLADTARVVCVDPERRPSPAAALGSAGRCAIESAPPGEDAETASSPLHPKPASAAGPMSCPTHEPPGQRHTSWHLAILL